MIDVISRHRFKFWAFCCFIFIHIRCNIYTYNVSKLHKYDKFSVIIEYLRPCFINDRAETSTVHDSSSQIMMVLFALVCILLYNEIDFSLLKQKL